MNKNKFSIIGLALVVIIMALLLQNQGRIWFSVNGFYIWEGDIWSAESSQQFIDPYSFSHMLHGLCFFGLLYWLTPKLSWLWRFTISTAMEAGWEILENSQMVINRYREETAALGYEGDSIINSIGDLFSCGAGFVVAYYLGWKKSIVVFVLVEIFMITVYRDSLLLNIIMLVSPIETLKEWQLAGAGM
jgi:hypothetical protein